MHIRFRILAVLLLMIAPACVSTGTGEITDSGLTAGLEAGKSTKAEVTARLGFPVIVHYGAESQETWEYYYVTEYPRATAFIPVVNALTEGSSQNTKALKLSFDRNDLLQNLQAGQETGPAERYPY